MTTRRSGWRFGRMLELQGHKVARAEPRSRAWRSPQGGPTGRGHPRHADAGHGRSRFRPPAAQRPQARAAPVGIVTGDYFLDEQVVAELTALGAAIRYKPVWMDDLAVTHPRVARATALHEDRARRPSRSRSLCAIGATLSRTARAPGRPARQSRRSSPASSAPTRTGTRCRRKTAICCACSPARAAPGARSRLAARPATRRSGSASRSSETGGELVTIEYDAKRAQEAKAEHRPRRPHRRRPCRRRRRVRGDPEDRRHVRLRLPRRVEARLPQVPRPDVPAPDRRAASSWRTTSSTSATK